MTGDEMRVCAEQGRYWYMRPDGTFYGSETQDGADVYLLDASPEWVSQWESWEQAAEVMTPLFSQLDEFRN